MAKIHIDRVNGFRFKATVGGFTVYSDQPEDNGGNNEDLNPTDLFVTSAGLCVATYAQFYAQKAGLDFKKFSIDIDYNVEKGPYRVDNIIININASEVPEKDRKRFESFVEKCLVTVSISRGIVVKKQFLY